MTKRSLALSITVFLLAVGVFFAIVAKNTPEHQAQPGVATGPDLGMTPYISGGGAVRLYPSGPEIMSDNSHRPTGLTRTYVEGCNLVVEREPELAADFGPIQSVTVDPDETLSRMGISVGLSGGNDRSVLMFGDSSGNRICLGNSADYARVSGPTNNVWLLFVNQR